MKPSYVRDVNKKGSLMNYAYQSVKDAICNNTVKPGDILSENQIANELGISRTPVREALRMLASEDYVEVRNGMGVIIKTISIDDIRNLMQVRKSLEMLAAETAIHNIQESEIDQMEQSFMDLLEGHEKKNQIGIQEFTSRDFQLHELLIARCSNKYIRNIMNSINANIKRFQNMSFAALNNLQESTEQHLNLLRLIRSRDSELLALALGRHIDWSRDCIINR